MRDTRPDYPPEFDEEEVQCGWFAIKDMGGKRCVLVWDHVGNHEDEDGHRWSDRFGVREHGLTEDELAEAHSKEDACRRRRS